MDILCVGGSILRRNLSASRPAAQTTRARATSEETFETSA
jgi:hypothetical protein